MIADCHDLCFPLKWHHPIIIFILVFALTFIISSLSFFPWFSCLVVLPCLFHRVFSSLPRLHFHIINACFCRDCKDCSIYFDFIFMLPGKWSNDILLFSSELNFVRQDFCRALFSSLMIPKRLDNDKWWTLGINILSSFLIIIIEYHE